MKEDIHAYARIGLVHQLLFPRCLEDADDHAETLAALVARRDIETFDCCLPYGEERRARLIPLIRSCGKEAITYVTYLMPLRKISFCSTAQPEQAQARMIVRDMVNMAARIGASGFLFASGGPAPAQATLAHHAAFAEFCRWLCGELKPHGITAMLEPFDTAIDKKFLYGPTRQCVDLIESLKPDVDNLGIELDVAHLPLMGERFEDALRTVAPLLKRVHLGNCVLRDPAHPRYGDTHPPIGFPGGEIDTAETATYLRQLLDIGYLDRERRGDLVIEITAWPGRTVDETIADNMDRLFQAWKMA